MRDGNVRRIALKRKPKKKTKITFSPAGVVDMDPLPGRGPISTTTTRKKKDC
jgi:hypothetical protein